MKDYSIKPKSENIGQTELQIWLINKQGDVLIKSPKGSQPITIDMVTICTDNTHSLLTEIEKQWGILCTTEEITELYEFESEENSNKKIKGLVLMLSLNRDYKDFISYNNEASFVPYIDLDEMFDEVKKGPDFNESFYSLLSYLDELSSSSEATEMGDKRGHKFNPNKVRFNFGF